MYKVDVDNIIHFYKFVKFYLKKYFFSMTINLQKRSLLIGNDSF